ncbi:hypothetical protein JNB62_03125 [Microbacterium jejuense]|uniref:DUF3137 domain-containing protein n=1 Tax=Microbacterium jejuense TaxID=1263637 RepID=A0ABS7HJR5_9MICO|nr:DUF3137 domain-containing protein [Microbacterium jejuense]MBW9092670.1 hypothetical protein [Microbacterium jejuense]
MTIPTPAPPTFDARPLVEPVPPGAAHAFVQELKRTGRLPSGSAAAVVFIVFGIVVLLVFGSISLTLITAVLGAMAAAASGTGEAGAAGILAAFLPLLFIGAIVTVLVVVGVRMRRSREERLYRLDRFARANAMSYVPRFDDPGLPGMIFSLGSSRNATDLVRGERPRFVEFGNYAYTTGSGKNRTTHNWGYVAVKLDVPLPNIVLDATSNNSLFGSNLPAAFDKDQRLSLEGDFDRYFDLYCPAGYETDALYLFTPDIMARFIDHAAALDVEIVDDWLFLYSRRQFSTLDPATWAWLFSVVGALLDKFAQWARWRDDRLATQGSVQDAVAAGTPQAAAAGIPSVTPAAQAVPFVAPLESLRPPPGVAPPGRRLRQRVPWPAIIVIAVFALFWILSQAGVFGALVGGLFGG